MEVDMVSYRLQSVGTENGVENVVATATAYIYILPQGGPIMNEW